MGKNKTYAEIKRDQYKEVIDALEGKLDNISDLSNALTELRNEYNRLEQYPESAEGKFSTLFIQKEAESRSRFNALETELNDAVSKMQYKLRHVHRKYDEWSETVKRQEKLVNNQ